jgi:hypothetical protein
MPEREPIVEEGRMPPGKAIAVKERSASDTTTRKADWAEGAAREPGMRKAAAHTAKAMSGKSMSGKSMATKAMPATKTVSAKSPMAAATAAVSSSPSR